jgi:hypothetical protein
VQHQRSEWVYTEKETLEADAVVDNKIIRLVRTFALCDLSLAVMVEFPCVMRTFAFFF